MREYQAVSATKQEMEVAKMHRQALNMFAAFVAVIAASAAAVLAASKSESGLQPWF